MVNDKWLVVNAPHILADGGTQVFLCFTYNRKERCVHYFFSSFSFSRLIIRSASCFDAARMISSTMSNTSAA